MVDEPWGPLPPSDLETPNHRGKFIDIEAYSALIENATVTSATITGATITNATITGGTIGSLTADSITVTNIDVNSGNIGGLTIDGSLTMGTGAIWKTADSGERWEWNINSFGDTTMKIYSSMNSEYEPGYLQSLSTYSAGVIDLGQVELRGIRGGDATDNGYSYFIFDVDAVAQGTNADLTAIGVGAYDATMALSATTVNGAANVTISATETGSGTASISIDAIGNGSVSITADSARWQVNGNYAGSNAATGAPQLKTDAAGSASTPAYSFQGRTNNGMYSAADDHLQFAAGGVQYLQIDDPATSVIVENAGFGVGIPFGTTLTSGYFYNAPPTTATAGNATWVLASGSIYYLNRSTSSIRYKDNIRTFDDDVALRPVRFFATNDEVESVGLIAEQVADVLPEAAILNADGEVEDYDVKVVLAALAAKINRLEAAYGI